MIRVHSYESMGTYDGPGIRLVVFLQGCPFRCLYCANPDTIAPTGGTLTSPEQIVEMAVSEKPFFGRRGGVTFSGGEPTMQAAELLPVVRMLHDRGIHVAIDSNGAVHGPDVDRLWQEVDMVLLDIKHIDPEGHRRLTGHDNDRTLATAEYLNSIGREVWARYVFVPGINDSADIIDNWGRTLSRFSNITRVEILPYHRLGVHKYEAMGLEYKLADTPEPTRQSLEEARELLSHYFSTVVIN